MSYLRTTVPRHSFGILTFPFPFSSSNFLESIFCCRLYFLLFLWPHLFHRPTLISLNLDLPPERSRITGNHQQSIGIASPSSAPSKPFSNDDVGPPPDNDRFAKGQESFISHSFSKSSVIILIQSFLTLCRFGFRHSQLPVSFNKPSPVAGPAKETFFFNESLHRR